MRRREGQVGTVVVVRDDNGIDTREVSRSERGSNETLGSYPR